MEEVSRRLCIPPQRPTNTLRPIGQQGEWVSFSSIYPGLANDSPHRYWDVQGVLFSYTSHWIRIPHVDTRDRHPTGPWTSHGIPHVSWDTGTGTSLVHGHHMGSHMYHGTLGQAPQTSHGIPHVPWNTGTGTSLVHGHHMGSHMYHGTLGQAPHWSMDIPWDPTCAMGHWDRHLTGPWASHGIPHVPWDTGTGTSLVHGHHMGSHMCHGFHTYVPT